MYILYYLKKQIPFWTHFDVIYHILLVEIVERKSMQVRMSITTCTRFFNLPIFIEVFILSCVMNTRRKKFWQKQAGEVAASGFSVLKFSFYAQRDKSKEE